MFKSIFSKVLFASLIILTVFAAGLFFVGCGDDDSSTSPENEEPEIIYDLYVDVASGNDSNPTASDYQRR